VEYFLTGKSLAFEVLCFGGYEGAAPPLSLFNLFMGIKNTLINTWIYDFTACCLVAHASGLLYLASHL
jgi:hypothetical protein